MLGLGDVNWQTISKCLQKANFFRLLVVLAVLACVKCLEEKAQHCQYMEPLYHVTLRGGIAAGDYMKLGKVDNYTTCAKYCCLDSKCDLAFMADDTCYNLHCYSSKQCETSPSKQSHFHVSVTYVKRGTDDAAMKTVFDKVSHDNGSTLQNSSTSGQKMVNQNDLHINESKNALYSSSTRTQTLQPASISTNSNSSADSAFENHEQENADNVTTEGNVTNYDNSSGKIPKVMVYWKNDSHIVVKEVLDIVKLNTTSNKGNTTSSFKKQQEESTKGPSIADDTLRNVKDNQITASNSSMNTFSTENSSEVNRTNSSNEISIEQLHKLKLEKLLSVDRNLNLNNDTQDQFEKGLLDKSFLSANTTGRNDTPLDNRLQFEQNGHSRGKSFQSKENGTLFDVSSPLPGPQSTQINTRMSATSEQGSKPANFDFSSPLTGTQSAQLNSSLSATSDQSTTQKNIDLSSPLTGNQSAQLNPSLSETNEQSSTPAPLNSSSQLNGAQNAQFNGSSLSYTNYGGTTSPPVDPREKFQSVVNSNTSSSVINLSIQQKTGERQCFSKGILYNMTLVHGLKSGDFSDFGVVPDMATCVRFCCGDKACNMALMLGSTCYTLHCASPEYCKVRPAHPSSLNPRISFVTQLNLPSVASPRDRDKSHLLPVVTPQKKVSKRIKGSRCQHGSIQNDVTLKSGQKAGHFKLRPKAKDMDLCLDSCCKDITCNVAFFIDKTCYSVQCNTHEDCAIVKKSKSSKVKSNLSVVRSKILPMNDKRQQIPKIANQYVTVINITNKVYTAPLADFESLEFLNLAVKVQTAISMMLLSFEEYKESEVISFKPSPLMTKVKLTVSDGAQIKEILVQLVKTLKAGKMTSSIDGVLDTFELSTFGFQFNNPRGFNLVCDPEFNYDVHWKLTVFDYQSVSPCPRKALGTVRRSCHGSKNHNATWGFPSFVSCETPSYKSLHDKAQSFADGAQKKIPFKVLQTKLKTTPSEILIQIQKLTFEDTYRAMLDMALKHTNKSISHANKGSALHDTKHGTTGTPKPIQTQSRNQTAKSLFSNETFSIPLPVHNGKAPAIIQGNKTAETKSFSRENIPKPPQSKPAAKSVGPNIKHSGIVKPPNVLLPKKPANSIPSRLASTSVVKQQPNIQRNSAIMKPHARAGPVSASQNPAAQRSSYYGNVRKSGQAPNLPQSPYEAYKKRLAMKRLQAAQARQRLLQQQQQQRRQQQQQQQQQRQQQQQQQQQRNNVFQNNQAGFGGPYQRGWGQNNPNMYNRFPQGGQTGFGGVPGYGYAGFRDKATGHHEKELSRKKRDVELVRVKRQGGNLVWYNQQRQQQQQQPPRQMNYNPTPQVNGYSREPILTNTKIGYDDPEDSRNGIIDESYFQHPTPYYQTETYRLGENGSPTEMPPSGTDSKSQAGLRFGGSYPTNRVTGFGDEDSLTSATPGGVSRTPGTYSTGPNANQFLVTTSKPPLYRTTAQQTPLNQQAESVMTTQSTLGITLSKTEKSSVPVPTSSPQKATEATSPKTMQSTIDALKKKLLDMTQSTPNTTTARPFLKDDFTKEKNRAPLFGGDIALIVDILRSLLKYNKYTNPPETIDTLKQFLQVGSHILDKRNKHEWKFLTKESTKHVSALDAAEVIEDYSIMVSKKLPPRDMKKPILTTNILVALRSVDLLSIDTSKEIQFPNYADPAIKNWTDATDTLVIRPQSLTNALQDTKVQLVSCSVRRLTDLLPKSLVSKNFGNGSIISGHVMSFSSVPSLGDMIDPPIRIVLSNNNKDVSQFEEQCVFWEKGVGNKPGKWSSRGCKFVESNLSHTTCECSHMSTFSAIANTEKLKKIAISTVSPTSPPEPEESNILYILLGILAILMILLVIMAVVYLIWKRRKEQQGGNTTNNRAASRGSRKSRSDESLSGTGSEEFDDMMASRRRNVHPDVKKGPMNSPRWQRMRKNGENPEDLMLKEKSYLLSDYHQPYHFLSAKTPEPSSSSSRRPRSRSS